jgi:hypothetical protein
MLIGERLANGNILYKDLWVNIGPLSAGFFSIMHWLFGKSIFAYHVVGFMLMFFQAILFNRLALNNKIYTENNYVPAVVYTILMSVSMDMFAVSPVMLSITFILLALNNIFGQVEFRVKRDEKILNIGIYLGLAALFYFPSIAFGLISILGLALFSATILRRYFLIFFGIVLPFLLTGVYYFLMDNTADSLGVFWSSWFENSTSYLGINALILLSIVPTIYLLLSIVKVLQGSRFSNYQARIAQMMLIWILMSLFLLIRSKSGMVDLIIFVPPVAYFITHQFILSKRKFWSGFGFNLFPVLIIGISYLAHFGDNIISRQANYKSLSIKESRYDNLLFGQKAWIVSGDLNLYKQSTLASKFYSWETYNDLLLNEQDNFIQTSEVYKDLIQNTPDIIVDQYSVLPDFFLRMPTIDTQYELLEKGVYLRKGYKIKTN